MRPSIPVYLCIALASSSALAAPILASRQETNPTAPAKHRMARSPAGQDGYYQSDPNKSDYSDSYQASGGPSTDGYNDAAYEQALAEAAGTNSASTSTNSASASASSTGSQGGSDPENDGSDPEDDGSDPEDDGSDSEYDGSDSEDDDSDSEDDGSETGGGDDPNLDGLDPSDEDPDSDSNSYEGSDNVRRSLNPPATVERRRNKKHHKHHKMRRDVLGEYASLINKLKRRVDRIERDIRLGLIASGAKMALICVYFLSLDDLV